MNIRLNEGDYLFYFENVVLADVSLPETDIEIDCIVFD